MNTSQRLSSKQIVEVLSLYKNAIAVYTTPDIIIEAANEAMVAFWGKDRSVIGKPLDEAVPELKGQPFVGILKQVLETGIDHIGQSVAAELLVDGKLQIFYFDYEYRAVKDADGQTYCILHTAEDVTERVLAGQKVQPLNDELFAVNEKLNRSQDNLQLLNKELQASEARLEQILTKLPAPVVVLMGPDQVISTTNESLLRFWNKRKEEVMGKPMLEVFPELKTQPFPALWKQVLETGETIAQREKPVYFDRPNGGKQLFYVDFYYQPLADPTGRRTGVLATVIDVTAQVLARQLVEHAETKLRLAIDSSELGTWYIDTDTKEFIPSPRLKQILGFDLDEAMTYEAGHNQIPEEYRDKVTAAVDHAIQKGESYEIEYPVIGYRDRQLRWVRATGKVYHSEGATSSNFSGTMLDITERKLQEQRKDDFISIASHELKTPITTLKASLQLLDRMKDEQPSDELPFLVTQANKSMNKLTSLIDDLLNTSRATEGQLPLNKTTFNVAALLAGCCNHIRMAGKHELILQGDLQLLVNADEHRIDQVIINMVNNAVKYAPASKEIHLIVERTGDAAKISVKDTGPGISSDKITHLFDRYYRADYGGSHYSGLGLGLYICAEIIKRHGGQIGAASELGKGSTFWFTLPLAGNDPVLSS